MEVGGNATFTSASFEGPVEFTNAHIQKDLNLDHAQFLNANEEVGFSGVQIGDSVFADHTTFLGGAIFVHAHISGVFVAEKTRFMSKTKVINFYNMQILAPAYFLSDTFEGPVTFEQSTFRAVSMTGNGVSDSLIPELNFTDSLVTQRFEVSGIKVRSFKASMMRAEGPTVLRKMKILNQADLSFSEFTTLDLTDSEWPPTLKGILLDGISYKYIKADDDERRSHAKLLSLVKQANFSASAYGSLETFFARAGYRADSDQAYIEGRWREWKSFARWYTVDFYWSLLLRSIGYGRSPGRALIPSAFMIALGYGLFTPSKMVETRPQGVPQWMQNHRVFHRFWYSLELFVPFVKLQSEDTWAPKHECRFLRHYMRIHILAGWILIPIALASITGLLK